jgi:hypothetical protein
MAWAIYCGLAFLGIVQGIVSLLSGIRAWLFARKDLRKPPRRPMEPATVIMPCKGAEPTLAHTVASLLAQDHDDYELIFVVESGDDPACAVIRAGLAQAANMRRHARLVVAGVGTGRSRKVHNLLAGVDAARPESKVLMFLDSDAIPGRQHLARLATRLHKPHIGATTGYRWYLPSGGLVQAVCCIWNAAALTLLGSHRHNFCWGGATAIRRDVFERIGVLQRWHGALSDDYQLTRCVREARLAIRFVPGCGVATLAPARWRDFLNFAHRQFVITRVCGPRLWALGTAWCALFCGLLTAGAVAGLRLAVAGNAARADLHDRVLLGVALTLLGLCMAKSVFRFLLVRRVVPDPAQRRGALLVDVLLAPLVAFVTLGLLISSAFTRRIRWRGTTYEMVTADQTLVLEEPAHRPHPPSPAVRRAIGLADVRIRR